MASSDNGRPSFWRAVLWATVVSGGLFLVLVIVLPALFEGESALGPARIIGGLVLHQDPSAVSDGLIAAGVAGHFFLSFVFTYLLALIVYRMRTRTAVGVGTAYGLALYLFNFYAMSVAFPWFADFRGATTFLSHLAFGVTAAWVFKRLREPKGRPVESPVSPRPAS